MKSGGGDGSTGVYEGGDELEERHGGRGRTSLRRELDAVERGQVVGTTSFFPVRTRALRFPET